MKENPHLVADRIIPLNSETDLCNMFIYSYDEKTLIWNLIPWLFCKLFSN